ncbi:MAG: hypothetical protein ACOC4J_04610 [Bacteroidota bacterium]
MVQWSRPKTQKDLKPSYKLLKNTETTLDRLMALLLVIATLQRDYRTQVGAEQFERVKETKTKNKH